MGTKPGPTSGAQVALGGQKPGDGTGSPGGWAGLGAQLQIQLQLQAQVQALAQVWVNSHFLCPSLHTPSPSHP